MPVGGWDTAPACIQHGVAPGDVYTPYAKCADFFTFGPGSTVGTLADGVSTSYWILTGLGIVVMCLALIGWVVLENRKLIAQAEHLRQVGLSRDLRDVGISSADTADSG